MYAVDMNAAANGAGAVNEYNDEDIDDDGDDDEDGDDISNLYEKITVRWRCLQVSQTPALILVKPVDWISLPLLPPCRNCLWRISVLVNYPSYRCELNCVLKLE